MLLCCYQVWGKGQSSCIWSRVLLYNQSVCSELNKGISTSCTLNILATQLACFWDGLKRDITGSTGNRYIIWDYRKDYLLWTAPLYFCVHLLNLCEEVRPSSKNKKSRNLKKPFWTEEGCVPPGLFSWEPRGSFCISRALEYTHKKVAFFLILRISVSSELVNLNWLIRYGICHAVWTKQSNGVVTWKCILVGTLMCSLYIETRFDIVYVAHGWTVLLVWKRQIVWLKGELKLVMSALLTLMFYALTASRTTSLCGIMVIPDQLCLCKKI